MLTIFLIACLVLLVSYNLYSKTKNIKSLSNLFPKTEILDPIKKEMVPFKNLWEQNDKSLLVLTFLRRFGWPLCRLGAEDLSRYVNKLNEQFSNSLSGAGVGLAHLDYDDFIKGNFFSIGKVYIDETKETYKSLEFGVKGLLSGYGMLNPMLYIQSYQAKQRGITGNMEGDGFQLGGTFIVDKQGNVIFQHIQSSYSDHPTYEDLLKAMQDYQKKA